MRLKMLEKITPEETSEIFKKAQKNNLIDEWDSAVIFYSFDILQNRLQHLKRVFPANVLHAIAIKTNSLPGVLRFIVQNGFGLEAASWEELQLAKKAGLSNCKAVFDSPAKRKIEIDLCSTTLQGMILNANCLEELKMIPNNSNLQVGLRINPLIKTGAPGMFDVSTYRSKFGVPINEPQSIIDACIKYPFITGLHMHSGSEIKNTQNNVGAIKKLKLLADEINTHRFKKSIDSKIIFIDIGGGIPADYSKNTQPGLDIFVDNIYNSCPDLFSNYKVITEFGHFIHAHTSWIFSDIEYVLKNAKDSPEVVIIHVGADMFVRQAYSQNQKNYRLTVLDRNGDIKIYQKQKYDIAGPLCFSGDYLFYEKKLPTLRKNDKLIIHNVGANTYSLWSNHCNRDFPKVIGYSLQNDNMEIIQHRTSSLSN